MSTEQSQSGADTSLQPQADAPPGRVESFLRKLDHPQLLPLQYSLILFVILIAPFVVHWTHDVRSRDVIRAVEINLFLATALSLPAYFLGRLSKFYFIVVAIVVAILSLLETGHDVLYKTFATKEVYYSIFSSDVKEAGDYFSDNIRVCLPTLSVVIAGLICFYFAVRWFAHRLARSANPAPARRVAAIIPIAVLIICGLLVRKSTANRLEANSVFGSAFALDEYWNEMARLRELKNSKSVAVSDEITFRGEHPASELHVLIVGEATTRRRMSLYGYSRNTNPLLSQRNDLSLFTDVITTHSHTVTSLSEVLTFADQADSSVESEGYSVVNLMKRAGFTTYWISNQAALGKFDSPVTMISEDADQKTFLSVTGQRPDGAVLEPLDKVLAAPAQKKFVVIHLMGCHGPYGERYPAEFKFFDAPPPPRSFQMTAAEQTAYNQYDNAVRYNDFIVNEIIKKVQAKNLHSSVVYVPDHGEEVYEFRNFAGHTEAIASTYMFDIPFIVWMSDQFRQNQPHVAPRIQAALKTKAVTDDLIHFYQDFLGIFSTRYKPSLSMISGEFKERLVRTMGDKPYGADSVVGTIAQATGPWEMPARIWVHRVDSVERLKIVDPLFGGVELDLVFHNENNEFDIGHPPVPSIGLTLETFLGNVAKSKEKCFWFDYKNLNKDTQEPSFQRLVQLDQKYGFKDHALVESPNPEFLAKFKKYGFKTSYYLPNLRKLSGHELYEEIEKISKAIQDSGVDAISQDISNLPIMTRYFGSSNKLLWDDSIKWDDAKSQKRAEEILKDPTIKVLLVYYNSAGYR